MFIWASFAVFTCMSEVDSICSVTPCISKYWFLYCWFIIIAIRQRIDIYSSNPLIKFFCFLKYLGNSFSHLLVSVFDVINRRSSNTVHFTNLRNTTTLFFQLLMYLSFPCKAQYITFPLWCHQRQEILTCRILASYWSH